MGHFIGIMLSMDKRLTYNFWVDLIEGLGFTRHGKVRKSGTPEPFWLLNGVYFSLSSGWLTAYNRKDLGTGAPQFYVHYEDVDYIWEYCEDDSLECLLTGIAHRNQLLLATGFPWCAPLIEKLFKRKPLNVPLHT